MLERYFNGSPMELMQHFVLGGFAAQLNPVHYVAIDLDQSLYGHGVGAEFPDLPQLHQCVAIETG